jgi:hypothetical protein
MYASIRRYEGAGRIDKVVGLVEEGFLPLISKVPGFLAYYAVDARYGIAVTISIFATRAGAKEADRMAETWAQDNLGSVFPNQPEITTGEVVVYQAVGQDDLAI